MTYRLRSKISQKAREDKLSLTLFPVLNIIICTSAEIAQSVEQGTENPRVRSSILRLGTQGFESKGQSKKRLVLFVWEHFSLAITW